MASTQRYNSDNLMPLHTFCDCGVAPITGDVDPGRVVNEQLLRQLKESGAAGDLSFEQAASRARARAKTNRAEAAHWREQAEAEDDATRRRRLERRAENYERRAAKQTAKAADLKAAREGKPRFKVEDHPELGPVIVPR